MLAFGGPCAGAQGYPSKAIRLISPYPPGGGTDASARIIAQALSDQLGQQVMVDPRGGASGVIGTEFAARAAPDGYTLMVNNVAPLSILPAANAKLPYDPLKDFVPISLVTLADYIVTVHPSLPARSMKELIALAKAKPGELSYGSTGNLSVPHLAGELLNLQAKIKIVHIPYKGNGPATIGLLSGETAMTFGSGPSVVPHIKAGKLRALATTGKGRVMPFVPSMNELLAGFELTTWYGVLAPAGVPKEILDRLHKEIVRAIANPKVAQLYSNLGTQPTTNTPDEFRAFIRSETEKYAKVIKAANIKAE